MFLSWKKLYVLSILYSVGQSLAMARKAISDLVLAFNWNMEISRWKQNLLATYFMSLWLPSEIFYWYWCACTAKITNLIMMINWDDAWTQCAWTLNLFLSGFISNLTQLAWEKMLCCCCCCNWDDAIDIFSPVRITSRQREKAVSPGLYPWTRIEEEY